MPLDERIMVIDEEEGVEKWKVRDSWGRGPLDMIWAVDEGISKGWVPFAGEHGGQIRLLTMGPDRA